MKKVVIVDDEVWAIEGLKAAVDWSALGFEIVEEFTSARSALLYLEENKTDVAIIDIRMPGIDGLMLIDRIRRTNNDMVFVIVSGLTDFENARQAVRLGVTDFLVKPVDRDALTDTLMRIKNKFRTQESMNLPDIFEAANRMSKMDDVNDILYREYFGLAHPYSYYFAVMQEGGAGFGANEELGLGVKGKMLPFRIYGKYLVAIVFTDVYLDYENVIRHLRETLEGKTFGISGIHSRVSELKSVVEESSAAFFSRFITGKKQL